VSKTRPVARSQANSPTASPAGGLPTVFAASFGALLGLALLKFPQPPILEKYTTMPANEYEWALAPWPIVIGQVLLGCVWGLGLVAGISRVTFPKWLLVLPLVWLCWQFFSGTQSVNAELTRGTLKHFAACVVCFYLGVFCLGRDKMPTWFFLLPLGAMAIVIATGFNQHFGGLESTRQYFRLYSYADWEANRPEQLRDYLKRIESDRIFSTLFYPNALAGALLLWMPAVLVTILQSLTQFERSARIFLAVMMGGGALGCLFWSGSKGGWLLALALGVLALLYFPLPKRVKIAVVALVAVGGLAGFALKYSGYFERKATSVIARFDYWDAAVKTAVAKPVFGTGPGTFAIPYAKIKRPESEMARLTHNDYLQQASDSGLIGFLAYTVFIVGVLFHTRPRLGANRDYLRFAVWLGVLGWALQGLLEFGLYIPALAWAAFALLGWLLATTPKPVDNPASAT
jgi:hypothetical protein